MSTAQSIIDQVLGAAATTLAGGYCVKHDGGRSVFESAHIEDERRNKRGRVTHLRASYQDGSVIVFKYSESQGATWKVG